MALAAEQSVLRSADPPHHPDRGPGRRRSDAAQHASGGLGGAPDRGTDRADRARHPRTAAPRADRIRQDRRRRRSTARSMRSSPPPARWNSTRRTATSARRTCGSIMRELSHRSKNLLAIVLAIARQTSRTTSNFEEFEQRFNARIQALADAHDLLVEQQWVGAALEDLVRAQLSAFGTERVSDQRRAGDAARRSGTERRAGAARARDQRVKYGALSVPEGRVVIDGPMDGARRRPRHPPDLARERRAAGDGARAQRVRPLRAGARHGQRARLRRHPNSSRPAWSGPAISTPSIWLSRPARPHRKMPSAKQRWRRDTAHSAHKRRRLPASAAR